MSWMKINNPDIDDRKIAAEIETEVERLKQREEETGEADDKTEPIASRTFSQEESALLEIAELYAAGWDPDTIGRRKPALKPFLPVIDKIFKRILKPQYIFNSLLLETVRKLEERIRALEEGETR